MAKTNFTKVEEALEEGIRKMTMQHLHTLADSIANIDIAKPDDKEQKKILAILKFELNWIQSQDPKLLKKLEINLVDLKKILNSKKALTAEDLAKIQSFKKKIDTFKKESSETDEERVEKERISQKTKRFNVNKNWLPLQ